MALFQESLKRHSTFSGFHLASLCRVLKLQEVQSIRQLGGQPGLHQDPSPFQESVRESQRERERERDLQVAPSRSRKSSRRQCRNMREHQSTSQPGTHRDPVAEAASSSESPKRCLGGRACLPRAAVQCWPSARGFDVSGLESSSTAGCITKFHTLNQWKQGASQYSHLASGRNLKQWPVRHSHAEWELAQLAP